MVNKMNNTSEIPEDISALLQSIAEVVQQARNTVQVSVNTAMVKSYWHIGSLIVEHEQQGKDRAAYGQQQIKTLAQLLTSQFGKGFDARNLRNMRAFYQAYPKWNAVRTELSWTHYRRLMRIENEKAREWYTAEAIEQNWSARALERQVSVLYYERLLSSSEPDCVAKEAEEKIATTEISNDYCNQKAYLRDPYILDFLGLPADKMLENDIEQGIINNLQTFLLELGKGFAFVERQQRISTEDQDFYLDLVFYNFKLKCFLLIDLKLGKLNHQDVGQMDTYVRIYDQHKKGHDDNPTIGLILCSEKSEAVAKYSVLTDSEQLFASKYLPYLPSETELQKELQKERANVQAQLEQAALETSLRTQAQGEGDE